MNSFHLLAALNGVALLLGLLRQRTATLIIAANQLVTLVGLANIARFGEPASQAFLPMSVFSDANLQIARNLFALSTALLLGAALLPGQRVDSIEPAPVPKVPTWVMRLLIIYFGVVIFSQGSILTETYTELDRTVFGFSFGGFHTFLCSVFLYDIVRRTREGQLNRFLGFGLVFGLFVAVEYLKGQTGIATGFVITAAMLIFSSERRPLRRILTSAALVLAMVVFAAAVRDLRMSLKQPDNAAVNQFVGNVQTLHESRSVGLEAMGNGSQYAAHVLECITLYESGVSRSWRSIYNPIIYTFQPGFLLAPLGIERPREAAWELGDYFIHGGGIFTVGELYWNGGYLCVLLVFGAIALFAWRCDTAYVNRFGWLVMACNFGPNLLQGMGYGFAQVSRGAINGLLALAIWAIARKLGMVRLPRAASKDPHQLTG